MMGCSPSSLDLLDTKSWRALLHILVALTIGVLLLVGSLRRTAWGRVVGEPRGATGLARLLTSVERRQEEHTAEEKLQRRYVRAERKPCRACRTPPERVSRVKRCVWVYLLPW